MLDLPQHLILCLMVPGEGAGVQLRPVADIPDRDIVIVVLLAELDQGRCEFLFGARPFLQTLRHDPHREKEINKSLCPKRTFRLYLYLVTDQENVNCRHRQKRLQNNINKV